MSTATWNYISRSPALARSSHSLFIRNGVIYIYGGERAPRTPVDAESQLIGALHSLNTNETSPAWNVSSAMRQRKLSSSGAPNEMEAVPAPRVGAAICMIGENMYLWGGRGGQEMTPLDKYQSGLWKVKPDAVSLTWQRVKAVNEEQAPDPRSYHTMASSQVGALPSLKMC